MGANCGVISAAGSWNEPTPGWASFAGWGEEVVGGFSFGLVFFLLTLPGMLLPLLGARLGQRGMFAGLAVAAIYWLLLGVVNSAARGIFGAALYRYATKQEISAGYQLDDLSGAWQPQVR